MPRPAVSDMESAYSLAGGIRRLATAMADSGGGVHPLATIAALDREIAGAVRYRRDRCSVRLSQPVKTERPERLRGGYRSGLDE